MMPSSRNQAVLPNILGYLHSPFEDSFDGESDFFISSASAPETIPSSNGSWLGDLAPNLLDDFPRSPLGKHSPLALSPLRIEDKPLPAPPRDELLLEFPTISPADQLQLPSPFERKPPSPRAICFARETLPAIVEDESEPELQPSSDHSDAESTSPYTPRTSFGTENPLASISEEDSGPVARAEARIEQAEEGPSGGRTRPSTRRLTVSSAGSCSNDSHGAAFESCDHDSYTGGDSARPSIDSCNQRKAY